MHLFELRQGGAHRTFAKPPAPPGYKQETTFRVEGVHFTDAGRAAIVYVSASVWAYDTGSRTVEAAYRMSLEAETAYQLVPDVGMIVIEIRLVGIEAMPVVGVGDGVPGPVGGLEICEDNPGVRVFIRCIAPHVEVAPAAARLRLAGALKPGVLIRGMVDDQLGDDP